MNSLTTRLIAAVSALLFVVAGCAGDTGPQWTYAPPSAGAEAAASAAPAGTAAPAASAGPTGEATQAPTEQATQAPTEQATGAPASGEARTIALDLTGALQITDANGQKVSDIPVTPGETITFQINNTAGFDHNFYIGTEAQLSVPGGTTDVGIPQWTTGVQELTWTVPADITGLKFGCTVPGHYALMQGTFSLASAPATAATPPATTANETPGASTMQGMSGSPMPGASMMPGMSGSPMATTSTPPASVPAASAQPPAGEARVIELEETAALQITDMNGQKVSDIPVTPGETITFRIDNTAGFDHDFYIGTDAQLSVPGGSTDVGLPPWSSGVKEFTWTVPADITGLKFGCTVPGHYTLMQGTFSLAS